MRSIEKLLKISLVYFEGDIATDLEIKCTVEDKLKDIEGFKQILLSPELEDNEKREIIKYVMSIKDGPTNDFESFAKMCAGEKIIREKFGIYIIQLVDVNKLNIFLLIAAEMGQREIIEAIIDKGGADVNKVDEESGFTPLHVATFMLHKEIIEVLIDKGGADVNRVAEMVGTPLHIAADLGQKEIMEVLIAKGANVNKVAEIVGSPLHVAARVIGFEENVEMLIAKGADVNKVAEGVGTPLHVAAREGHKENVEMLIAKGADVNKVAEGVGTPLHVAAIMGSKKIVEILICKDADVDNINRDCKPPIYFAAAAGRKEIVEVLLKNGAKLLKPESLQELNRILREGSISEQEYNRKIRETHANVQEINLHEKEVFELLTSETQIQLLQQGIQELIEKLRQPILDTVCNDILSKLKFLSIEELTIVVKRLNNILYSPINQISKTDSDKDKKIAAYIKSIPETLDRYGCKKIHICRIILELDCINSILCNQRNTVRIEFDYEMGRPSKTGCTLGMGS